MAPTLPSSLSPHVCILSSPDVHELFESSGLPPIAQTLQSFVPLPQGMSRRTSMYHRPCADGVDILCTLLMSYVKHSDHTHDVPDISFAQFICSAILGSG